MLVRAVMWCGMQRQRTFWLPQQERRTVLHSKAVHGDGISTLYFIRGIDRKQPLEVLHVLDIYVTISSVSR